MEVLCPGRMVRGIVWHSSHKSALNITVPLLTELNRNVHWCFSFMTSSVLADMGGTVTWSTEPSFPRQVMKLSISRSPHSSLKLFVAAGAVGSSSLQFELELIILQHQPTVRNLPSGFRERRWNLPYLLLIAGDCGSLIRPISYQFHWCYDEFTDKLVLAFSVWSEQQRKQGRATGIYLNGPIYAHFGDQWAVSWPVTVSKAVVTRSR